MKGPDFIIVGAMKCGTSTLQAQLATTDGIFMTEPKEPNFFSDDDVFARGESWYAGLYADARPDDMLGEASTHYTKLPTYPKTVSRLAAAVPNPKIIYILRDPVQRAISHYMHGWSVGWFGDDPVTAVREHPEIIDYGRYGMQITPFVEQFGKGAIHLMSLEHLRANGDEEMGRLGTFLGLSRPLTWKTNLPKQNVSSERVRPLPMHGLLVSNPIATRLRRILVPQGIRKRIRDARTMKTRPHLPDGLKRELEDIFLKDREVLSDLFPNHAVLSQSYPFATQQTA